VPATAGGKVAKVKAGSAENGRAFVPVGSAACANPQPIVDWFVWPLAPSLFEQIVTRLRELANAMNSKFGAAVFTTATLAAEFPRLGYDRGVEEIDEVATGLDDGMLQLRAAVHIGAGRVKIAGEAFAKYHPARFCCSARRHPGARRKPQPEGVRRMISIAEAVRRGTRVQLRCRQLAPRVGGARAGHAGGAGDSALRDNGATT
jgi:hypothetical protein